MRKCVYCEIIYKKGSKISFHRFPTDLTVRRIWLYNMKFFNWSPKENDALCSKHFDDACFIEHQNRRALKLGSVPTIFKENSEAMHTSTIIQNVASSSSPKRYSPCGAEKLIRVANFEVHTPLDSSTAVSNDHNYESPQTLKKSRIEYGFAHDHQYGNSPNGNSPKYQKKALEHHKKILQDSLHKKTSKKHLKRLEIKEPHKNALNDPSKIS